MDDIHDFMIWLYSNDYVFAKIDYNFDATINSLYNVLADYQMGNTMTNTSLEGAEDEDKLRKLSQEGSHNRLT